MHFLVTFSYIGSMLRTYFPRRYHIHQELECTENDVIQMRRTEILLESADSVSSNETKSQIQLE